MRDNSAFLQLLINCHKKQRRAILQTLSERQLRVLSEIILNLLRGNIPISSKEKRKLFRKRRALYQLASKRVSSKDKKKILVQQGGGLLDTLLPPALTLLSSLLI